MNKDRHAEYDFATIVDISGFKQFLNEANLPLLSYEQDKELAARIAKGDEEARNQLILSNLRWVVKLATRYTRDQVSIEDLFQEGIFGLLRAVEKYNPARGRFSTYATWWIRQTMIRSIDEMEQPIHMPVYQVELLRRFKNVINRFTTEQGREPTVDELAEQLHFSLKQIHFLQEC